MKKEKLSILGLSYSMSQIGSYILVLTNEIDDKKIPIIIRAFEAQRLILELEGISSSRPMMYDILKGISDEYGIVVEEVFIYELLEGIFFTKIITSNGNSKFELECTVGDGIVLSVILGCPIYTTTDIIYSSGIVADGNKKRIVSVEDLERMMKDAVDNEDYETASELRDRISELKSNGT
jgi:bifunctional DNase/RNase